MAFWTKSVEQIGCELDEVRLWYESLGIRTEGTRLDHVAAKIREVRESRVIIDAALLDEASYYALTDAAGFAKIMREFSRLPPDHLPRKKLRTILAGPLIPAEEVAGDPSGHSRDIFLELELAAELLASGIDVVGFDDVNFLFEGVRHSVECKRPYGKLAQKLARGYEQISGKMECDSERGLVGVAVEKMLSLESRIVTVTKPGDLVGYVHEEAQELFRQVYDAWRSWVDQRVVAVVLVFPTASKLGWRPKPYDSRNIRAG